MKNNIFRQLLKLTATALACAVILIIGNPTIKFPEPGKIGSGQNIEAPDRNGENEEPGISPMNDKDKEYQRDHMD